MKLYPLTFQPVLKEKIWGGTKLKALFDKGEDPEAPVGESWEIADLDEGQSIVKDGELAGKTLQEVIHLDPKGILGASVHERFGNRFPLLIKFIDAAKDLSIQVHPSDETSPTGTGKTEMWYIMQADPGAELTVGFKEKITKEAFAKNIEELQVEEAMDTHVVKPGDSFFINAGRIHAIGGGVLLAEIQQTSDVTYRVYDYNRPDADGNLRDLHIQESLDVLDFEPTQDFKLDYDDVENATQILKHHTYFKTDWLHLINDDYRVNRSISFTILIAVDGEMQYTFNNEVKTLKVGQTLLIPAGCEEVTIDAKDCTLLEVHL
ncbi:MAG: mannose-6-phosphate isomerase [Cytophagaceae bacterium]|nr:mannose-6-phosphate isomerase [Cytophagaceae bacterium]|tara:strand:+ start:5170 stop:6129 length:960 start_codon:yes stop_codon:yes gene_type:complete